MNTFKSIFKSITIYYLLISVLALSSIFIMGCATSKSDFELISIDRYNPEKMDDYQVDKFQSRGIKVFRLALINVNRKETPGGLGPMSMTKRALDDGKGIALKDAKYKLRSIGLLNPYFLTFSYARIDAGQIIKEKPLGSIIQLSED